MQNTHILVESTSKEHRQSHINLESPCLERGGTSTNHKGVLAQYLNTTIPYKTVFLCHACNNGKCSNPQHLYWGTPQDNIDDAIEAGVYSRIGSKRKGMPGRKWTEEEKERHSNLFRGKPSNNKLGINGASTKKPYKKYKRLYQQKWITNGKESTRIPYTSEIPEGWYLGRTIPSSSIG